MQQPEKTVDLRAAVQTALVARGLSVHAVGMRSGVNPDSLYPFLSGKSGLRHDKLERVLGVLNLEVRPAPGRDAR
jgi:transcriptional regulator with XRE-family HTH domain